MPDCFSLTPPLQLFLVYDLCLLSEVPTCTISINGHERKIYSSCLPVKQHSSSPGVRSQPGNWCTILLRKQDYFVHAWWLPPANSVADQEVFGAECVGIEKQLVFRDMGTQSHTWEAERSVISSLVRLSLHSSAPLVHPFPAEVCSKLPATEISTGKMRVFHCPT